MSGPQDGSSPDDEARKEEEINRRLQRDIAAALEEDRQVRQQGENNINIHDRMDSIQISMDELNDLMDQVTSAGRSQDQHLSNKWGKTKQQTPLTASSTPSRGPSQGSTSQHKTGW